MSDQLEQEQPLENDGVSKLVPVGESIKYRRRAQQAEGRLQELEQQLKDLQAQFDGRSDELAAAEAQRDEARASMAAAENRMSAERMLMQAGVADMETATMLLARRVDLAGEIDTDTLTTKVEQLLLDKPFLRGIGDKPLPPRTASPRSGRQSTAGRLAQAAQQAITSGSRRDVAQYLRLRRQAASR